jgi:hypothetical protein
VSSSGKRGKPEAGASASALAKALDASGQRYRKVGQVRARRATEPIPVRTILADGTKETTNIAQPGDYIVTAPSGERWVVKAGTFEARYAPKPRTKTVYLARGEVIAVENPLRRPISILAPWGEQQHGAADCMIADVFDPAKGRRAGEPYIIARSGFERTYKLVRETGKKTQPSRKGKRRKS